MPPRSPFSGAVVYRKNQSRILRIVSMIVVAIMIFSILDQRSRDCVRSFDFARLSALY